MEKPEAMFLAEFIRQSDRIENISNDYPDLLHAVEEEQKSGHVGALIYLRARSSEEPSALLDEDILLVQRFITLEQPAKGEKALHPRHIGRYRDCGVSVAGDTKASPEAIPSLMRNLLRRIGRWQRTCRTHSDRYNIAAVSALHYAFEEVHPFADGNGRTGRALVYYLLRFAKIPPFVFTNETHDYYRGFSSEPSMRDYFLRKYFCALDPTLLGLDFRKK